MARAVPPGGPTPPPPAPAVRRDPPAAPAVRAAARLSVVIVNFCQWRNTARLTRQLRRSEAARTGAAEVVVVDNCSPPHPTAGRLRRKPGVTLARNGRNLGFARAVNRGVRLTAGDWVLLLNPDVTAADGFLDDVLAAARKLAARSPAAGVVGFRLNNRDGSGQPSAGPFPTLANTLGGLLLPRARRRCRHRPAAERAEVPWVTGGCLLVRRDCFDRLGGLDEGFFVYYEDVDFCRRARAAGWSVWYEPGLEVTHHWPLHARRVPAPLRLMTRHALLTYTRKHWPGWQARVLAGVVWAEARGRETLARWRGDPVEADCYRELRRLVGDVAHGRAASARRRIRFAAGFLDTIAAEQDGRTG